MITLSDRKQKVTGNYFPLCHKHDVCFAALQHWEAVGSANAGDVLLQRKVPTVYSEVDRLHAN